MTSPFAPMLYHPITPTATQTANYINTPEVSLATEVTTPGGYFSTNSRAAANAPIATENVHSSDQSSDEDDIFEVTGETLDFSSLQSDKKHEENDDDNLPSSQPSNVSDDED